MSTSYFDFVFGRGVRLIEPATPEVARTICLPGETFWAHREIHVIWNIFKTHISKHVFEQTTFFWNKQQLIFEHTGLSTIETQNARVLMCSHLSCLDCQTVACLTMIKHCSWEFSELSWHHAFPATRPGRSDTFEILWFETYGTIRFWQRLFFEQPICETQLFDTWVHAACMVWSALIFWSWWKETVWI